MPTADKKRSDTNETRRAPRRSVIKFIWFKLIGEAFESVARTCDVSTTGIGLFSPKPVEAGKLVFVEVITERGAVSMIGKITYCRDEDERGLYRFGVQIDTMPPNDRGIWKRLADEGR